MSKKKFGAIVAETHWDREWYSPFQGFRRRLVRMIDDLIETMEKDPDYTCFFFDGQTVVLEDYLEIRPENRERLQALVRAGRIAIGPWYCMPDEFLVGDEPLVRNFMRGHRDARQWGVEPCKCGYVCDIFGHNSQFPQILNGFGIDNKTRRRSEQTADLGVTHEVTLRKGSGRIEVRTTIDNTAKDHIIKVLFPTHLKTDTWRTDTPYDIIERPFELPDRSNYREVDTRVSPTLGYIDVADAAGGLAIFTKALYEVEPYDIEARTIALTLMRGFANVTGDPGSLAGQLLGAHTFDYAMSFHKAAEKDTYNECGRFKAGLRMRSSALHGGSMPGCLSMAEVNNPGLAVTAVKRAEDQDGACVVRLVNLTDESVEDTLWFGAPIGECVRVDLNEEGEAAVEFEENEIPLKIGAKQILTLRITPNNKKDREAEK
jgi:alpha-mannosidase